MSSYSHETQSAGNNNNNNNSQLSSSHELVTTAAATAAAVANPTMGSLTSQGGRTGGSSSSSSRPPPPASSASQNATTPPTNTPTRPTTTNATASSPPIRHAGRAHVRGKIRRIWRPRYLELCDNGLVRYYEVPPATTTNTSNTNLMTLPYSSSSQQQQHKQDNDDFRHVNMIPKYTLQIFEARILDVTTLRDMHCGLPSGSFGFVFRGQRLELHHLEEQEEEEEEEHDLFNTLDIMSSHYHNHHHQHQNHHPSAASTTTSSTSTFSNASSLLPSSCAPADLLHQMEQRDFLCAVSTLEEAQMWVVALQWAASITTATHCLSSSSSSSLSWQQQQQQQQQQSIGWLEPWWNQQNASSSSHHGRSSASASSSAYQQQQQQEQHTAAATASTTRKHGTSNNAVVTGGGSWDHTEDVMMGVQVLDTGSCSNAGNSPSSSPASSPQLKAVNNNDSSIPKTPPPPPLSNEATTTTTAAVHTPLLQKKQHPTKPRLPPLRPRKPSKGKVVVTKVARYRTVRLARHHLEIAFEIHGMVLRAHNEQAEQWSILRTANDFELLLQQLCQELGPAGVLDDQAAQKTLLRQLPRLQDRPTLAKLQASLSVVDSWLRSLVMDAAIVNATALKLFLAAPTRTRNHHLHPVIVEQQQQQQQQSWWWCWWRRWQQQQQQRYYYWWKIHNPCSIISYKTVTLQENVSPEQFVKQWLQDCSPSSSSHNKKQQTHYSNSRDGVTSSTAIPWDTRAVLWLQQRPLLVWGGLSMTVPFCIMPLTRLWQNYTPTISMRLDFLVVSWIGAAYLGSFYSPSTLERTCNTIPGSGVGGLSRRPIAQSSPRKSRMAATAKEKVPPSPANDLQNERQVLHMAYSEIIESDGDDESDGEEMPEDTEISSDIMYLPSPLPQYPANDGHSCWSQPKETIFYVRGATYLKDRVKILSDPPPLTCRGVDVWMTDSPQRHIARHPAVLGGKLADEDTFLVNFLLPFGNLVAYFSIPPRNRFPKKLHKVWTKFLAGDQQYRDARLKLLPVVAEGPWIVKAAVGPGKSPAVLGKVIPLQYFFRDADRTHKGVYEVDVIITASSIAKSILSVVKGHTKSVSIAFAFIIEGVTEDELPETVLACYQLHSLHLEDCPILPDCNLDEMEMKQ